MRVLTGRMPFRKASLPDSAENTSSYLPGTQTLRHSSRFVITNKMLVYIVNVLLYWRCGYRGTIQPAPGCLLSKLPVPATGPREMCDVAKYTGLLIPRYQYTAVWCKRNIAAILLPLQRMRTVCGCVGHLQFAGRHIVTDYFDATFKLTQPTSTMVPVPYKPY